MSDSKLRHEFFTPIHQIVGYAQLLQEELSAAGHEGATGDLKKIEAAAQKLIALVDGLSQAPRPKRSRAKKKKGSTDSQTTERKATGGIILVVDDEEMNRDMLARRLENRGYKTLSAADGEEALRIIGEHVVHLVLLDVMMPGLSGIEVLREIRTSHTADQLPVIMATARDTSDDVVEALAGGANDYVTKPIDFDVAFARLETHLSLRRASEELRRLNTLLGEAQERIARLMTSSPEALDDLAGWCTRVSADLAGALGAKEVAVWVGNADGLEPLTPTALREPSTEVLRKRSERILYDGANVLIPVSGLTGETYGMIVVSGRHVRLNSLEEKLVLSFAHQLGGAVEVRKTRDMLAAAHELKESKKQELLASGVALLAMCNRCGRCYEQTHATCEADGVTLTSPRLLPFSISGRYRLVRLLGQGGMGTVFEAFDERLQRPVAIKLINAERLHDSDTRLRFEREAHALAKVTHPGVIDVFDSGELHDGSAFLVMELLHGCDLRQLLHACGPGTPAQVSRMLVLAASALTAAHRAGVIHRDIKPANIFLTGSMDDFQVKIVDFGIAKPLDASSQLTETGMLVGTPAYMSPEQLTAGIVDARTDVYGLTAAGFEALTGRRVTEKEDFASIIVDVLNRNTRIQPSRFIRGVPPGVDEAFLSGLAVDPDQRPATPDSWVRGFAEALAAVPAEFEGWRGDLHEIADRRDKQRLYVSGTGTATTVGTTVIESGTVTVRE